MNNEGQVAFFSMLQGIGAGAPYGIFRWDGNQTGDKIKVLFIDP
jgi:hypothetical protein